MPYRLALCVLLAASALVSSLPASAAVTTYSYQILGGSSSGSYGVGTITGGAFSVQYPDTPWYTGMGVQLLSATVVGTAGTQALTPVQLSGLGSALVAINSIGNRSAVWNYAGAFQTIWASFNHYTPVFTAVGNVYIQSKFGGYGNFHFLANEVAVPEPASGVMLVTGGLVVGAYVLRRARRSLS